MTTGSWDPSTQTSSIDVSIDPALLNRFIALVQADAIGDLRSSMSEEDKRQNSLMQADTPSWQTALADHSDEHLIALIRFFTVVEMQLPNWVGGAKSPVISINKLLRSRGQKLDRDMLLWIKANSDNRFIPNGSPL